MYYEQNNSGYIYTVFIIGLVIGFVVIILGGLVSFKKKNNLASGLSLSWFLGLLTYYIGSYATCNGIMHSNYFRHFNYDACFSYPGYHLRSASITAFSLGVIGFAGFFIPEPYQYIIIGLGIGTSLASFSNWYSNRIILDICLTFFLSFIFAFLMYRYPTKLYLGVIWLGSYFMSVGLLALTLNSLWLSGIPFNLNDAYFMFGVCIIIILVLFTFISCCSRRKNTKQASEHNELVA